MNVVVFWVAMTVLVIIAVVMIMMIIGSWVSILTAPPGWLSRIKVKDKYAIPIAKRLVVESVILVGAVSVLIVTTLQERTLRDNYRTLASNLLCQAKSSDNPPALKEQIAALAKMNGEFEATLRAYRVFLANPEEATIQRIEDILPPDSKRNVFDLRLLALLYLIAADRVTVSDLSQVENRRRHLDEAKRYQERALKLLGSAPYEVPGEPEEESKNRFVTAIKVNNATVNLILGELERIKNDNKLTEPAVKLLNSAATDLNGLWRTVGPNAYIMLNLMASYSLLDRYSDADNILKQVASGAVKMTEQDRFVFRREVKNLQKMHQLKAFVDDKLRREHVNGGWPHYVDTLFEAGVRKQ